LLIRQRNRASTGRLGCVSLSTRFLSGRYRQLRKNCNRCRKRRQYGLCAIWSVRRTVDVGWVSV